MAAPSNGEPPRVCVVNLGCRVNRVESDWMEESLAGFGCAMSDPEHAQVIIVNSCAVTGEAQAKTRQAVRRAASRGGVLLVGVTGCAAALDAEGISGLSDKVVILPSKLTAAQDVIAAWRERPAGPRASESSGEGHAPASRPDAAGLACEPATDEPSLGASPRGIAPGETPRDGAHLVERVRRGVKVQDGCDNRCTYCVVWKARGASRSVALDRIDDEVALVLSEGACEIDLTGVNLGRFEARGDDGRAMGLAGLIERVCSAARGRAVVRSSSLEPQDVTADVLRAMARNADVVCPHLHLPLQSGCDETLALMRRRYDSADFSRIARDARATVAGMSLTTDVIAGFPGETEERFERSLEFCRSMGFSKMHVFRYSARPGTPAASMAGQVDPEVSRLRARRLRELSREMRIRDARLRVGDVEHVIVERVDERGVARGSTGSYHDVVLDGGDLPSGGADPGLYEARLRDVDDGGVLHADALVRVRLVHEG